MKYVKVLFVAAIALFAGAMILTACMEKMPEIKTPTAVVGDLSAMKDQYVKDLQAKVDDYQAKIDELKKKAETMSGTAKDELNRKIDVLSGKEEEARAKIKETKAAGEAKWEELKSQMETISKDLDVLYNDALSLIK